MGRAVRSHRDVRQRACRSCRLTVCSAGSHALGHGSERITTADVPLEDYTINAFTAWKVGRKGLDDGLVLFVFPQDRKLRIEVGYGLESSVTDAAASEIIRDVITPGNGDVASVQHPGRGTRRRLI
jgi:hypothetical protein